MEIKSYKYPVGYNIVLDSQIDKSKPEIHNLDYDELVLEETGEAKIEGYKVEPRSPIDK